MMPTPQIMKISQTHDTLFGRPQKRELTIKIIFVAPVAALTRMCAEAQGVGLHAAKHKQINWRFPVGCRSPCCFAAVSIW
jgi:hypothetical protein